MFYQPPNSELNVTQKDLRVEDERLEPCALFSCRRVLSLLHSALRPFVRLVGERHSKGELRGRKSKGVSQSHGNGT